MEKLDATDIASEWELKLVKMRVIPLVWSSLPSNTWLVNNQTEFLTIFTLMVQT